MKKEREHMPIPLRPLDPAVSVTMRPRRREMAPRGSEVAGENRAGGWMRMPFQSIRREPDLAVARGARPSDNDGWPCQPLTRR